MAAAQRAAGLFALALLFLPVAPATAATRAVLEPGLTALLADDGALYLEALPRRGEGLQSFAQRLTGTDRAANEIAAANRGARRLLAGRRYRVPYARLRPELKVRVVRELFTADRAEAGGWRHRVPALAGGRGPTLGRVAEWFCGRSEAAKPIAEFNRLSPTEPLPAGTEVVVSPKLLLAAFRELLPQPDATQATAPPLDYGEDEKGRYALYRLQPGEALYSAVVVRFTGQLHAEDVIGLAREIAERSGIADVTDIPVGYPVKIPLDWLQPEFLPSGDARRQEYEARLRESAKFKNEVRAAGLEGITVVLDAGHGGVDVGASIDGAWESLYVYDVMLRLRRLLLERTLARVVPTTRDGAEFRILDRDRLPASRGHQVLTTPPYPISDAGTAVHLRWYLANSALRRALAGAGSEPVEKASERVVFVSIHADSLHPSLRGATAYVPSAEKTAGSFEKRGAIYEARAEVREQREVSFTPRERTRSEGLSRQLAEQLVRAFRAADLAVHPFQPVRDRIVRQRRAWVPAVLRHNAVPAKVLLEICNLANAEDRGRLLTQEFRQRVAEAMLAALLTYYGEAGSAAGAR